MDPVEILIRATQRAKEKLFQDGTHPLRTLIRSGQTVHQLDKAYMGHDEGTAMFIRGVCHQVQADYVISIAVAQMLISDESQAVTRKEVEQSRKEALLVILTLPGGQTSAHVSKIVRDEAGFVRGFIEVRGLDVAELTRSFPDPFQAPADGFPQWLMDEVKEMIEQNDNRNVAALDNGAGANSATVH